MRSKILNKLFIPLVFVSIVSGCEVSTIEVSLGQGGSSGTLDGGGSNLNETYSINIQDQQIDVNVSTILTVTFSNALTQDTINAIQLYVNGPDGLVAGTVASDSSNTLITFTPDAPFSYNTTYSVSVDLSNVTGFSSSDVNVLSFTTSNGQGCIDQYAANFALVTDFTSHPVPAVAKPEKAAFFMDQDYGACVTRLTDHAFEPPVNRSVAEYSRRSSFNADSTYVITLAGDGYWHLYNAQTTEYIKQLSLGGGSVEPLWHPSNPSVLYKFQNHGGMSIMTHNVETNAVTEVVNFDGGLTSIAGYPSATSVKAIWPTAARLWTKSEGSPSVDARYWALMVETSDFNTLGFVTYDMQENAIIGVYDLATDGAGIGRPDHISMSPTGAYVVPSWNAVANNCPSESELGTTYAPCGLMSFTPDYSTGIGLASRGPHSDVALDANGNDVIVITSSVTGDVEMISLADGTHTPLWNKWVDGGSAAMHISGTATNKPGWVLISTYAGKDAPGHRGKLWFRDVIMIVELKEKPQIFNLARTYNAYKSYWTEPHANVNKDFTKIIFNSNWLEGNRIISRRLSKAEYSDLDAYIIDLPDGLF